MKNRWVIRAAIVVALGSSLAIAAACSSASNEADPCFCEGQGDAAYNPDSSTRPAFVDAGENTSMPFGNDLCLPNALPTDGGLVDCHVALFFPGAISCVSVGLGIASPADNISLVNNAAANGAPLPYGSLCALDQLPANACLADAGAGWCYEPGGCGVDAGCAQSLCTSSGYTLEAGTYTWLLCP
ncbi:MAG: hypothetical protein ABI183_11485 [Polyangiaceae bacterium]